VEKNGYPTPKQTQKNNAKAKPSLPLKQTCGNSKNATPTQRRKKQLDAAKKLNSNTSQIFLKQPTYLDGTEVEKRQH
jgi:hypothetical protein